MLIEILFFWPTKLLSLALCQLVLKYRFNSSSDTEEAAEAYIKQSSGKPVISQKDFVALTNIVIELKSKAFRRIPQTLRL